MPRTRGNYTVLRDIVSPHESRPDRHYQIRQGGDGVIYCTCPGWRFRRRCRHLDQYNQDQATTLLVPPRLTDTAQMIAYERAFRAGAGAPRPGTVIPATEAGTIIHGTVERYNRHEAEFVARDENREQALAELREHEAQLEAERIRAEHQAYLAGEALVITNAWEREPLRSIRRPSGPKTYKVYGNGKLLGTMTGKSKSEVLAKITKTKGSKDTITIKDR